MPELNKPNSSTLPANAIVLFGLSDDGKPQAGLFPQTQTALAKKAAKRLHLSSLSISTADLAGVGKIPAGRLYANRRSFIPNVRREVHERLLELAKTGG